MLEETSFRASAWSCFLTRFLLTPSGKIFASSKLELISRGAFGAGAKRLGLLILEAWGASSGSGVGLSN